ncbi:MAG: hypothetical protein UY22_C0014G0004 [Candidatus Amesbacteria bacterium GW2011_GWC1_48_10]|uniref:Uncharacterized protein n=1 Tax=Candidatus Amesbacteria bacterium GW2011_GWC1_48_10 TaxID=1618365 RepID=A0A0G1WVI7_9BACT|nr:MAG: hypothetical protein UY22_C0014G0004 [Candidatus Amesbacteria bacterium GW2011_GWC1_48_10]
MAKTGGVAWLAVVGLLVAIAAAGGWGYLKEWKGRTISQGTQLVEEQLVEGFPQIPVMPGAALVGSGKGGEGDGMRYSARWETMERVPGVMQWYKQELVKFGWVVSILPADLMAEEIQLLTVEKAGESMYLSVIRKAGADKTEIVAEFPALYVSDEEKEE